MARCGSYVVLRQMHLSLSPLTALCRTLPELGKRIVALTHTHLCHLKSKGFFDTLWAAKTLLKTVH